MPKRELHWRKARKSYGSGACVELAVDGELIALRNSHDPGVEIRYSQAEFAAFLDGAKRGEFDHLLVELP
jgi:Domain of unknown function (DUF397)